MKRVYTILRAVRQWWLGLDETKRMYVILGAVGLWVWLVIGLALIYISTPEPTYITPTPTTEPNPAEQELLRQIELAKADIRTAQAVYDYTLRHPEPLVKHTDPDGYTYYSCESYLERDRQELIIAQQRLNYLETELRKLRQNLIKAKR